MKITFHQLVLLVIFSVASYANKTVGQSLLNSKVSITVDKSPVKKLIPVLEKQTGAKFSYSSDAIDLNAMISCRISNMTLGDFLNQQIVPLSINYRVLDNEIIMLFPSRKEFENQSQVLANEESLFIQKDILISGIVKDEKDNPLEGATILERGTNNKIVTNKKGEFKLNVKDTKSVLVVSYIGYNEQIVIINNKTSFNLTLNPNNQTLEDVVVIGYGTIRKSDLTGSVVKLKVEGNEDKPITTIDQFIQGRAAGVQLTQNSGAPGSGMTFLIRGASSISGSNQPLIVVDGYPVETSEQALAPRTSADTWSNSVPPTNPLAAINPNDIESIEILKDASSTAIYGSRGANGVVMITTKKGKSKADQVSASVRADYSMIPKKIEVLRTPDYIDYINEARKNSGLSPQYNQRQKDSLSIFSNSFWQDLIYQPSLSIDNQLSLSGGDEKTKYTLSGNYRKVQGIVKNSAFSTGSVRLNIDRQVTKKFKVSALFSGNLNINKAAQQSNGNGEPSGSLITGALNFSPILDPFAENDEDPNLNLAGNPLTLIQKGKNIARAQVYLFNLKAEYKILDGLSFLINSGVNSTNSIRNAFLPKGTFQGNQSNGLAVRSEAENVNYLAEYTLNYNKVIKLKHRFNAIGGYTYQQFTAKNLGFQVNSFVTDVLDFNNLSLGSGSTIPITIYQVSSLSSFLGRFNYTYNSRYLFTLTGRSDGSSRLSSGNQWAFFPAIAIGWNMHNEKFFSKNDWVSEIKLRSSYGKTGNQSIGVASSKDRVGTIRSIVNGAIATALQPSAIGNTELTWETTDNINLGMDASFLKKRITFSAEIYLRTIRDLLINLQLPGSTGFTNYATNFGTLENKGLELTLNARVLTKKLTWNIASNISFNRNKIISLGDNAQLFGGTYWRVGSISFNQQISTALTGRPIGAFFGYTMEGIYQTNKEVSEGPIDPNNPKPGDIKYKDINGDGRISLDDRSVIGNPFPDYTFGITNDFSYKRFSLSIFIMGNIGQEIANMNRVPLDAMTTTNGYNIRKEAWDNRWRGEGTSNYYPAPKAQGLAFASRFSNFFLEDGSFIRLKNVTLAYQIPVKNVKFIKNAKLFVSATNLFTLSNYKGYDPEVSAQGNSALNPGVDIGVIPQYKTYSAGLNILL